VSRSAGDGSINDIEHVVIFMQENRAFDHYYGSLKGIRGFDDNALVTLPSGKPVWYQPTRTSVTGSYMLPWHLDTSKTNGVCGNAPAMSYPTDIAMWNEGRIDAWNTARSPGLGMSYYARADLDFYHSLADQFTICDQYFQATFTQTNPNRLHLFSGSNGLSVGETAVLDNTEPKPGFNWITVAEILEKNGVSWRVYQQTDNFDDNGFAWFKNFQDAQPGSALYDKGMYRSTDLVEEFGKDMEDGVLPQVSWLIAPTNLSEHANHMPPFGEDLTARILKKVAENPKYYSKMAFFLNYDEGGQFFDHHWTPTPPVSEEDGKSTVTTKGEVLEVLKLPIGLGFRVPMTVISPWTRGGYVNSQVFDHTSVIQFLEKRFNVQCPNISPWRRAMTGDLLSIFNFTTKNETFPELPDTSDYVEKAKEECTTLPPPEVPAKQQMPHQEPGVKKSRALPYMLEATGSAVGLTFTLNITNSGSVGSPFYLYDNYTRSNKPRKYAVESGKKLTDNIQLNKTAGKYSYALHGPNGFVRTFSGSVSPSLDSPSLVVRQLPSSEQILLEVSNPTDVELVLEASFNTEFYGNEDNLAHLPPLRSLVAPGEAVTHKWNLKPTRNWYDFTVFAKAPGDATFTWRAMGRMENGKEGISDPFIPGNGLNKYVHKGPHPDIPEELSARTDALFIDLPHCRSSIFYIQK